MASRTLAFDNAVEAARAQDIAEFEELARRMEPAAAKLVPVDATE